MIFRKIISRKNAAESGLKRFFTGKPCKNGHLAERYIGGGCTECAVNYCKEYKKANPELILKINRDFEKRNKKSRNARHYLYNIKNKEKRAKKRKEYRKNNPDICAAWERRRRAKKRAAIGSHTIKEINNLKIKQLNKCANCFCDLGKNKSHVDHIQPLSKGGSDFISNIQILCQNCNLRKSTKNQIEFAQEQGRLL